MPHGYFLQPLQDDDPNWYRVRYYFITKAREGLKDFAKYIKAGRDLFAREKVYENRDIFQHEIAAQENMEADYKEQFARVERLEASLRDDLSKKSLQWLRDTSLDEILINLTATQQPESTGFAMIV